MAGRSASSLRYQWLKLALAASEAAGQLSNATSSLPEAIAKGLEAYSRQLTATLYLTGAAMAPTLNPRAGSAPEAVETLLVRLLPRPSERTVFTGDVVAFKSPLSSSEETPNVLVRRVAAMPGDELVTDDADEEGFALPVGHCWVLADNEELQPRMAIDSRTFGPLPLHQVIGRILYAARSPTDHGPVENSEPGMEADAPVAEAELDVEALLGGPVGRPQHGGKQQRQRDGGGD